MYLFFTTIGLGIMILATYAFHCQSQTYKVAENKVQQKQSLTRKKIAYKILSILSFATSIFLLYAIISPMPLFTYSQKSNAYIDEVYVHGNDVVVKLVEFNDDWHTGKNVILHADTEETYSLAKQMIGNPVELETIYYLRKPEHTSKPELWNEGKCIIITDWKNNDVPTYLHGLTTSKGWGLF